MDLSKAGYIAILIIKYFKNSEIEEVDIFKLEKEICNSYLSYTDMLYGLTLLYAIGVVKSKGVLICLEHSLSEKQLLGLSRLILH